MAHSPPTDPTARLLGESPPIQALRTQIRHLAAFDTMGNPHVPTLLLQGETGTGKGLVAQVMHDSGPRASGPFVEVNCAAIPDTLIEAELFGYEAGAFSEAKRAKLGLFEAASGGTLFLDEIDSLPLSLQAKLLTVIEGKRVRRLGAVREQAVDVKLIAAAQTELSAAAHAGRFRADLYHRLAVIVLTLPPLRARAEDILVLAQAYVQRYATAHRVRPKRLSPGAEAWLNGHRWPGNVRELSHLLERLTLLSAEPIVDADTLVRLSLPPEAPIAPTDATPPAETDRPSDEAARIRQALHAVGGNVVQAARRLGLSRGGLRYRMQRHGITPPAQGTGPSPRRAGPASPPTVGRGARAPDHALPSPTDAPTPASGWEQKPVAVLAIDLTFPTPSAPVEPWTAARQWEEAIGEKVRGFGGVVLQRLSSLFAVAFGVPQALEQLPQRAVHTALAIRQLVADAQATGAAGGRIPEVRQAVHLGAMLVETQAGALTERYLAVDETLSVAIRLLGQARPGEILVSAQLGRLVAPWCELQAREGPSAGRAPTASTAYHVAGLGPRRAPRAEPRAVPPHPCVGRTRELGALQALLAETQGGRGQAVGVVGEPGVGKSRLLLEFYQHVADQHVAYLEGRCLAHGSATPYLSVLDLLREHCGIAEADGPEQAAAKVRQALREVGLDPDERAPYLLHLLGQPGAMDALPGVSPAAFKHEAIDTVCQLSLQASQKRPLLLAVEDLQWVDPSSADVFAALVERLASAPVLFLATYRPGYRPPWLERSYATQLALPPLAPEDSRHVVRAVCRAAPLPESVTQAILARAEGNPLFLEELTWAVLEQGEARAVGAVPNTLQGVLLARIDRLSAEARRALQVAAVVGRDSRFDLIEALWEGGAARLPPALAQLTDAELLYQRGHPPQAQYRFKHALIQEAAYQSLVQSTRPQAHRRVAQVLSAQFPELVERQPELLAYHYTEAGLTAEAIPYWQQAGQRAVQRSANPEAVQHLTKGLAQLVMLPETPARAQQELDLQMALGPALMATKGQAAPEVEQTYARARMLCAQVGETPQLFPTLRGLCWFYLSRGAFPTARELGEQLDQLAERTAVPTHLLEAHDALGGILLFLGEYAAARTHLELGIALTNPAAQRALALRHGVSPTVRCLTHAAPTLWCLGYPAQALRRSQEALALAQALTHPLSLALAQHFAANLYHSRREIPAVQVQADALLALATAQGFPLWAGYATCWRGWARVMQGQGEAGMTQLRQGMAAVLATGQTVSRPAHLVLLAEAAGHIGQVEEGLRLVAEALTAFKASGRGHMLAESYRLQGEFLLRQADPDEAPAEACFQQALDIARRQEAKSFELRAAMSLARLWQQQGKGDDARQLLAEIYAWFTEGFDTADLQEAKALLEELSR